MYPEHLRGKLVTFNFWQKNVGPVKGIGHVHDILEYYEHINAWELVVIIFKPEGAYFQTIYDDEVEELGNVL